jgi:hypothetical protein
VVAGVDPHPHQGVLFQQPGDLVALQAHGHAHGLFVAPAHVQRVLRLRGAVLVVVGVQAVAEVDQQGLGEGGAEATSWSVAAMLIRSNAARSKPSPTSSDQA